MLIKSEIEVLPYPKKSPYDRKEYKLIKLPNGLKVLLVKNAENLKNNLAAVALCIDVGSFDDPLELQGLAHFLEHMVFMGSAKYPKENEFDQFIKNRNGFDNAMTEVQHTIFYFKLGQEHLSGALDRFSHFFINPLLLSDSMEREIEAVESEFQNNIYNDTYRINQIYAAIARDQHPVGNFTWGNLSTLKNGIDSESLHQIVHEFRKRFYKSNRMNLCIQSSVNLDILQAIVARYFVDIKPELGSILKQISIDPHTDVFKSDFHKKIYYVKSMTKKRKLYMTFLLPALESDYKNKSLDYLAYLFTYEGRYSLMSYFKKRALALHITAKIGGRNFEGNSMFTFFTIEIGLTREGFESIDRILDAIFSYLLIIKMTPMDEHKVIYDELKEIKNTLYAYRNERPLLENVQELALNMKYCSDEDVVVGRDVYPEFDESSLKRFITIVNERKFNLLILCDNHRKFDKIEKWFGTEYSEVDFPAKYSQLWNERWIRQDFSLPSKNNFICRSFQVLPSGDEGNFDQPNLIFKSDFSKCFFKPDYKFLLPHGFVYIHFTSPLTHSSVENLNLTSIFSMCIKSYLTEKLYPATLAGYTYKLNSVEDGLILKLSGFREKLLFIVDIITRAMRNTNEVIDKMVFDTFKKELKKNCYNFLVNSNQFVEELRSYAVKANYKFYYDRYKNIDKIDYNIFKEFLMNFLQSLKFTVLIQGNFTEIQALEINSKIAQNLNIEASNFTMKRQKPVAYQIPLGSTYIKVKSLLPNDKNSVIKNYYQIGECNIESECLLELLVKTIREPLFNHLRTKQQIGYSVGCAAKNDNDILGFSITVESQEKRNSARLVDAKIEKFLWDFLSILEAMCEDDFETVKRSVINQKRLTDIDLESEVNRHWNEIRERKYQFDRSEIQARQMELLNKDALIIFFKEFLLSSNKRKLSTQILANVGDDDSLLQHGFVHLNFVCDAGANHVKNLLQFKEALKSVMPGNGHFL